MISNCSNASAHRVSMTAGLLLAAASCFGLPGLTPAFADASNPSGTPGAVRVSGNQLMRDGKLWIPHGYYQIAFEVSPSVFDSSTPPFWKIASRNYTPREYADMRNNGADSIRIQLSQPGMDPQSSLSTPEFRQKAISAITAARAAGLTVIVSIQDEPQTKDPHETYLPNDATRRVWALLAPIFGKDDEVVFELFNEPGTLSPGENPLDAKPSAQDWQDWQDAMNATIGLIRSKNATNVVVADGLAHAEWLAGAPALQDRLDQVVYAAHPYAFSDADQKISTWDLEFGAFSQTHPVIISEWGVGYNKCGATTPSSTVQFIQYLQNHQIGLEIGAWDWSGPYFGSARWHFPKGRFSSFLGTDGPLGCNSSGFGTGKTVQVWYSTGTPASTPQ